MRHGSNWHYHVILDTLQLQGVATKKIKDISQLEVFEFISGLNTIYINDMIKMIMIPCGSRNN